MMLTITGLTDKRNSRNSESKSFSVLGWNMKIMRALWNDVTKVYYWSICTIFIFVPVIGNAKIRQFLRFLWRFRGKIKKHLQYKKGILSNFMDLVIKSLTYQNLPDQNPKVPNPKNLQSSCRHCTKILLRPKLYSNRID